MPFGLTKTLNRVQQKEKRKAQMIHVDEFCPFVVITPARDEAAFIETTIHCMLLQTAKPTQWVIVDDGSTDETGDIIDRWAAKVPWITAVHLGKEARQAVVKRGRRALEAKEIEAFYQGYDALRENAWQFIVKLDADLQFRPDYFRNLLCEFAKNPMLGIAGGVVCNKVDLEWKVEQQPHFHVRGATKVYRRECWDAIGGVRRGVGWDTLDEVHANMLGWRTRSFDRLSINHLRPTGAANGAWPNGVKNGLWMYVSGYSPLYVCGRCIWALLGRQQFRDSVGMFYGFLGGYFRRLPQVDNQPLIRYLRNQQHRKLLFMDTIWK